MFGESLNRLIDFASLIDLDLKNSFFNLDSGFDSEYNKFLIRKHNMIPNIKVNSRGTKDRDKLYKRYDGFNPEIYKQRFNIERTFAWADTYRKLVIRYEKIGMHSHWF